jgi:hypothetical protein
MSSFERWRPRLLALCDELRERTRAALLAAEQTGERAALSRPHAAGAGDVTFGLDVPAETCLAAWIEDVAREEPVSLLTEDAGWRHRVAGARGRSRTSTTAGRASRSTRSTARAT